MTDPSLARRVDELLEVELADDTLAWTLGADGTWTHVPQGRTVDTHLRFQELALARASRLDVER